MKKYLLFFICVLFFYMADAQTSTGNGRKAMIQVKGDAPVTNTVGTNQRTERPKFIISPNPPPKADPARAEFAKRKQPQAIKELKTN